MRIVEVGRQEFASHASHKKAGTRGVWRRLLSQSRSLLLGALALVLLEELLAQANVVGRDFNQLVVIDELDGLLQ